MKSIKFLGSSLADLRAFPEEARYDIGTQLRLVQQGLMPSDWKSMSTVGRGAIEIRVQIASGAFRVVYVASIGYQVFVLHCFQKKTQKTSKRDIVLAAKRYRQFVRGDE